VSFRMMFVILIFNAVLFRENIDEFTPNSGENMPGFAESLKLRTENIATSFKLIWNAILHLLFGVPVPRRVKVA